MELKDKLQIISNHQKQLLERHKVIGTHIARLTAQGCIDAKEYWKDGKYLYLLWSMKDGFRRKKYIGNHPLRIKEARQKIENYKDRLSAIKIQNNLQEDIDIIDDFSNELLLIISKNDLSAKSVCLEGNLGYKNFSCRCGSAQHLYPNNPVEVGYN